MASTGTQKQWPIASEIKLCVHLNKKRPTKYTIEEEEEDEQEKKKREMLEIFLLSFMNGY